MITEIWGMTPEREGVAVKDVAVAGQAVDPFLDAGAAGIVDADQRRSGLQGQLHDVDDFLGVHLAQGTAQDGEVLGKDIDQPVVDLAEAGDHPVAQEFSSCPGRN